mgnify:CR=1 FL=1
MKNLELLLALNPEGEYSILNDEYHHVINKNQIEFYFYKEDFENFQEALKDATNFIINEKGEEVISERHQPNFDASKNKEEKVEVSEASNPKFTNVSFDDI